MFDLSITIFFQKYLKRNYLYNKKVVISLKANNDIRSTTALLEFTATEALK